VAIESICESVPHAFVQLGWPHSDAFLQNFAWLDIPKLNDHGGARREEMDEMIAQLLAPQPTRHTAVAAAARVAETAARVAETAAASSAAAAAAAAASLGQMRHALESSNAHSTARAWAAIMERLS
jgi:hypothetical protein